jgi:hypothetical protein
LLSAGKSNCRYTAFGFLGIIGAMRAVRRACVTNLFVGGGASQEDGGPVRLVCAACKGTARAVAMSEPLSASLYSDKAQAPVSAVRADTAKSAAARARAYRARQAAERKASSADRAWNRWLRSALRMPSDRPGRWGFYPTGRRRSDGGTRRGLMRRSSTRRAIGCPSASPSWRRPASASTLSGRGSTVMCGPRAARWRLPGGNSAQ